MLMLKRAAIAVVSLIVLLAVIGLFLPREVTVERSMVIDAPASVLYAHYADLRRFNDWSPWAADDPETEYVFEGAARGRGQIMHWSGEISGTGTQSITLAEPYHRVEVALDFGSQGTASSAFLLEPAEGGTQVTWSFHTDFGYDLMGRYLGLVFDSWVGGDYERGLTRLSELVATLPRMDFEGLDYSFTEVEPLLVAYVGGRSEMDADEKVAARDNAFAAVEAYMAEQGLHAVGTRMAMIGARGGEADEYRFDAAIPVDQVPGLGGEDAGVRIGRTYGGEVLMVEHSGGEGSVAMTYAQAESLLASYGLTPTQRPFEEYLDDGDDEARVLYFPLD